MRLNEELAIKQNITEKQRERILEIYEELLTIFDETKVDVDLEKTGPEYATEIERLEFELQDNWNFERSIDHHTWWNLVPGCTCAKMDNAERFGHPKYITVGCPFHSPKV